ncbi:MAG: hypothetical protein HKP61_12930 [Dactylosporangium sp.]|nr:hypothetical protein [Dactylosporangium sp.]NNJ61820.1 hypothetical protein [Dactylosporangium sp.]
MRCRPSLVTIMIGVLLAGSAGCAERPASSTLTPLPPGPSSGPVTRTPAGANTSTSKPSGGSSPALSSASGRAVGQLRTAVAKASGQSLGFVLGDGVASAEGRFDVVSGGVSLSRIDDGRTTELVVVDGDLYLLGVVPSGAVLHVVVDQLPGGHDLLPVAVPLVAFRLLGGVTRAESSTNDYSGRLDLTKVDAGESATVQRFLAYLVRQAGDRADDIPFTATVDGFGRLAGFRAELPRADHGRDLIYEFAIRTLGGDLTVARPGADLVEAPASLYAG